MGSNKYEIRFLCNKYDPNIDTKKPYNNGIKKINL